MSKYKIVVIGGSAGSFPVVTKILANIKKPYPVPVIFCLHRLKHVRNGFVEALSLKSNMPVREPDDKETIKAGVAYLAPANYHLFAELGNTFSLSTEEMRKFSRPSIDLTFETCSYVFRDKMVGILLSGANTDGAQGICKCNKRGGYTIIQDPDEAMVKTMVEGSLKLFTPDKIATTNQIIDFLNSEI